MCDMYRRRALTSPAQVEISSMDIADALAQMAEKHRYREARRRRSSGRLVSEAALTCLLPQVLFMADTCQAATLAKHFYAPGASLPRQMRTPSCE
jgi:hypothetical protein